MKNILITSIFFFIVAGSLFAQTPVTTAPPPARSPLRAVSRTQYTPHTELFAEYRPLLLNTAGRFTAHLTKVDSAFFKPYTDAEVTLTLTINGKTAWMQKLNQPVAAGIYRFAVTSNTTGIGTVTIDLKTPIYSEIFVIDSVVVYPDEATAIASQASLTSVSSGEIAYYKEKSWLETFATLPVAIVKKAIMVPQTAVLSENGAAYVYVQVDPEHFRKQVVETGKRSGNTIEINKGLKPTDRIVVLGADKIK